MSHCSRTSAHLHLRTIYTHSPPPSSIRVEALHIYPAVYTRRTLHTHSLHLQLFSSPISQLIAAPHIKSLISLLFSLFLCSSLWICTFALCILYCGGPRDVSVSGFEVVFIAPLGFLSALSSVNVRSVLACCCDVRSNVCGSV